MLEVGRFAGEALAVLRVFLVLAPPEIRRVGDVGIRGVDDRQAFLGRADDEGGAAGGGGVFQGVAGLALGGVHADGHGVARHARADQSHGHDHGFGAGLAGELHVGRLDMRRGSDGFGHNGRSGLDGVRVRFGPDPDGADLGRVDPGAFHGIARRLEWTW